MVRDNSVVCVVGLGYVGYPEAIAFSKYFRVIGYDIDYDKLCKLEPYEDLMLTNRAEDISQADFVIIAVPTPIDESKKPVLSFVESASETVGRHMKKGAVVILESTVYPGVTEDIVVPILEKYSGYRCGYGFKVAYSPERINPGDAEHDISKVTKVISGMDKKTTDSVSWLYGHIAPSICIAKNIKTAEAVKVVENVQRDINIALMNELSFVFKRMDINIRDVIEAASTKWNFYKCYPGMVGGHCIPVDPYYLIYKSEKLGYSPTLIDDAREINNDMPKHIAAMAVLSLSRIKNAKILIAGVTYKENVPDIRESPAKYLIKGIKNWVYDVEIIAFDPLVENIKGEFGVESPACLADLTGIDCIIVTVMHDMFKDKLKEFRTIATDNPVLVDVRGGFNKDEAEQLGFRYFTL